jgi:hypothetical protein
MVGLVCARLIKVSVSWEGANLCLLQLSSKPHKFTPSCRYSRDICADSRIVVPEIYPQFGEVLIADKRCFGLDAKP